MVGGEGFAPLERARVRHGWVFWGGERGFVECGA
jgi:hypothetical protein